jgi:hypothetical protein
MKIVLALLCVLPLAAPAFGEECPESLSGFLPDRGFVEVEVAWNGRSAPAAQLSA